jgi:NAD(P)-dependent dehydrogenase (short-subunit alcohol dehydrogenase family)
MIFCVINDGGDSGYCIVEQLLQLGHEVLLLERNPELPLNLQNESQENLQVVLFDFYQTELIENMSKEILASGKKLNGLIYAAGMGGVRPLAMNTTQFIHKLMNANLYTFLEFVRVLTKKALFENGGSIVAISSVSSIKGLKSKITYSASKAALDASVRGLAVELADRKIRVNSVRKGWVEADLKHDFIQDNMALSNQDDQARQLLGTIGTNDLANLVCFLLSDQSKFISGTNVLLDGTYTIS